MRFGNRKGRVLVTSCGIAEDAKQIPRTQWDGMEAKIGLFTYLFAETLEKKGKEADANADGRIDLIEVFRFVRERVSMLTAVEEKSQTPRVYGSTNGEFVLSGRIPEDR